MPFPAEKLSSAKILVIDDDPLCVRSLIRILKSDGYESSTGNSDPALAVADFSRTQPDLILLDWHMGPVSGAQVLASLQHEFSAHNAPAVIVMTGDCDGETKRAALEAGAADFLTKPLDYSEIVLRIRNHLRLRSLHQHVQSENCRLEELVHARTVQLRDAMDELKSVQQQVIADERMRAFASMAGGVAHDFNNALMIICGYSELYTQHPEKVRTPAELLEGYGFIALASHDASEIVRRLREFYRPFSQENDIRRPVDINKLVEDTIALARPRWETQCRAEGVGIAVTTVLQELPLVHASDVEIREVLLNLILNAVDAMPQGGSITLKTIARGKDVQIEVEDNGTGMTPETYQRCLEPFFSTKGDQGTGLGLAIVYGIIQRHSGTIQIRSELNHGTCITLSIPQCAEDQFISDDLLTIPIRRHLRILLVDDDPSVCAVLRQCLELDEHSVTIAGNGCEALERFNSGAFDLVMADRVMPKMSGDQLAQAIREINPTEPIILLTAFEAFRVPKEINFLINKPASLTSIRDAISRVMGAAQDLAA